MHHTYYVIYSASISFLRLAGFLAFCLLSYSQGMQKCNLLMFECRCVLVLACRRLLCMCRIKHLQRPRKPQRSCLFVCGLFVCFSPRLQKSNANERATRKLTKAKGQHWPHVNGPGSTGSATLSANEVGVFTGVVHLLPLVVENAVLIASLEGKHHLQNGHLCFDQQLIQ